MAYQTFDYGYICTQYWMKDWERDIHNVFNLFAKELSDKGQSLFKEIETWRNDLVRQIDDHAAKQKRLLEQEYRRQKTDIQNNREQRLSVGRRRDNNVEDKQINQLISQCKALKFELGVSEYPENSIPFIKFMTEEQVAQSKLSEAKAEKKSDNTPQNNSSNNFQSFTGNNGYGRENSSGQQALAVSSQIK